VSLPAVTWRGALRLVAADSPTDVWAVGGSTGPGVENTVTRVLRYDGSRWSEVPFPVGNTQSVIQITGLSVAGGHAWLVGNKGIETVVEEWDGQSWQARQPPAECLQAGTSFGGMPTFCTITAVTAFAPDDVWAGGNGAWPGFKGPLLFHWDGIRWRAVQVGINQQDYSLTAIAGSATDLWAAGGPSGGVSLVVHGDGRSWQVISGVPTARLTDLGLDAAGRPWLIEDFPAPSATLASYTGTTWTGTDAPRPPDTVGISLYGITAVPDTSLLLAVGAVDLPTVPRTVQAVILEYTNLPAAPEQSTPPG
jgi:hypothetical protein